MNIKIVNWNFNQIYSDVSDIDFILERNSWNDYGYNTSYSLHAKSNGSLILIGAMRILKKGQNIDDIYLLELGVINSLSDEYCSLGNSLDYYERLLQLEEGTRMSLLDSLNDIIRKPDLIGVFNYERGFVKSILRDKTLEDDIFTLAPVIITGKYENLPDRKDLNFSFQTTEMKKPIIFDFTSKQFFYEYQMESLPNRICVIVGRNGSGKSTLLSKIGRLVFSSSDDRSYIKEIGRIEPNGLGFPRIVNISYSAFDSFKVPGVTSGEKKQISQDMEKNQGRYIYCGVRDVNKEVEDELKVLRSNQYGKIVLEDLLNDKYEFNYLKSISTLNEEFAYALIRILQNDRKKELLKMALRILSNEPSLNFLNEANSTIEEMELNFFNDLSTGHKFVLHSVIKLIYHIEKRSLVLFDEPESHLHPPLLAVLMKTLRMILEVESSFMIMTTHSPVVIQETLQKHVIVIRREGDLIKTTPPTGQTFGENIGTITTDIFGLSTDYTDYHTELDKIVKSFNGSEDNFENHISQLFDGNISMQAYAYLVSKFKNSKK